MVNPSPIMTKLLLALAIFAPIATFAQNATGLKFLDEAEYEAIPLASPPLRGEIPRSVDLRKHFPNPGSQGDQPSCVGWATAYALKSYQEVVERKWKPDSNERLFSPSFVYNQIKLPGGGAHFVKAFDVLIKQGAVSLADFPYQENDDSRLPDAAIKQKAEAFRVATWRRVENKHLVSQSKGHLASKFPVLIGATVGQAFQAHRGAVNFNLPPGAPPDGGGHAMAVIGYDDDRGAFKVINSWGPAWGDNGYAWIAYDTFDRIVNEAYVIQDIVIANTDDDTTDDKPADIDEVINDDKPLPSVARATVGLPGMVHNQPWTLPNGVAVPAMAIRPTGSITNGSGKSAQVIIRFYRLDGRILPANDAELAFRDVNGQVAAGTSSFQVQQENLDLSSATFGIPYYAMNLGVQLGTRHDLKAIVHVYIDGFEVARSQDVPFWVMW